MDDEARTAVERAEREPLLGHRAAAVRAAIDAAAPFLESADHAILRARLLLRLASVKMTEGDYEGADQALQAVGRHAPDDTVLRFLAGVRACHIAIRRGPEPRALASATLVQAAARLPAFGNGEGWEVVTVEVALAIAELALHDDPPDPKAFDALAQVVTAVVEPDVAFAGHQLLAAFALSIGEPVRAARSLRIVVPIARDAGSPADEVEARLALAGALVATTDAIARDEAAATVARALELAKRHELAELHAAALIAEAGVLASGGKTAHAIDRVLELAREAAQRHDIAQYVASVGIMAELYARSGDHVSAFRTIVEAHRALADATGVDVSERFRPLLARLRDRIGADRLSAIARDVEHANRLADQIAHEKTRNPS
jgi:tetratricopeptide (TPR) repeat protein